MSTEELPSPPPGLNYIAAIKPSLNFIFVVAPLGAILVPTIIVLLFFSTTSSRKQPVFILNIFACLLGLTEAFLIGALMYKSIVFPLNPPPQLLYRATVALALLSPVFIDSILLTRVLAFFPRCSSSNYLRLKILAFPILIKTGRLISIALYLHNLYAAETGSGNVLLEGAKSWPKNPYITSEWTLQIVDNAYCSVFFLIKLRIFERFGRQNWVFLHPTLLARVRGLFRIALGNFIFPIIFNIAQITLLLRDPSYVDGTYIVLANDYVTIIGVVFATIWTSGQSWKQTENGAMGSTWNQEPKDSDDSGIARRIHRAPSEIPVRLSSASLWGSRNNSASESKSKVGKNSLEMVPREKRNDDVESSTSTVPKLSRN